jgi:hypothetical protein
MMKAEIKTLKIELGNSTIELKFKDAEKLFRVLKEIFDKEVITISQPYPQPFPQPYPICPGPCPYWQYPDVIYTCDNGTAEYNDGTVTLKSNT